MYKISVPLMIINLPRSNKEELLKQLKNLDADRVFLAFTGHGYLPKEGREKEFELLKEYCAFFKSQGFEVGAWINGLVVHNEHNFIRVNTTNFNSKESLVCPSDENYIELSNSFVTKISECGVELIMLDDDFRYGFLNNAFGCLCHNHIKKIEELLGESITREFLKEKLLSGGKNKYRDAFLRANGHYMESYAKQLRDSIDKINPNIRLGFCTCMTSWDIDGTTPDRISRIMAGNTKPFYRLIGAPYWAIRKFWGRIEDVIELERMESSWRQDDDIEIFCEGDVYPRPRWQVPAAYLEGLDTAMRAANSTDGILKYAIDYNSSINYEHGYIKRHMHNKELYKNIEKYFANKNTIGVRVYEYPQKYANLEIYPRMAGYGHIEDIFFSMASSMLACNSIPTVYNGSGICGIAFGENARYLTKEALQNGLILDIEAARILKQQGIDTGIEDIENLLTPKEEYFIDEDEYVALSTTLTEGIQEPSFYRVKLNSGADIKSLFITQNDEKLPASYLYKNKNGQRFLVFTFDAYFNSDTLRRQYTRARQLSLAIKWLSNKALPADILEKSPDLYMMCKEKENALAVGLWNFSVDIALTPKIKLAKSYKSITFINCSGKLEGDEVFLCNIAPYDFAGFEVK